MSTVIESLEIEVRDSSNEAVSGIDALTSSLSRLKVATKGGMGLTRIANNLRAMASASASMKGADVSGIEQTIEAISKLKDVKVSSTIGKNLNSIASSVGAVSSANLSSIDALANSLTGLSSVPKANLTSAINQLKKIPELTKDLARTDIDAFANQVQRLTLALQPLASEMNSITAGFNALPGAIKSCIKSTDTYTRSNKKASVSVLAFYAKLRMAKAMMTSIANVFGNMIDRSAKYTEMLHMFDITMGEYAESAKAYVNKVSEIMGIDPGEYMEYQATFQTLIKGFGVATDKAATMSQQLTNLGYDLSSYWDISYEDVMQKLQSGISGQIKGIRTLGYDLSDATLSQIALKLGIEKTTDAMTQAEKTQLRYYALLTQMTDAQTDMGATLESPSNSLRILKAQLNQCARAIGDLFIPMLSQVVPYLTAVVRVVRKLADLLGILSGFKVTEQTPYDLYFLYGVDDTIQGTDKIKDITDSIADDFEEAKDDAKKIKSYMLGFDELNLIDPNTADALDTINNGNLFDNIDLPTYDFLSEATESKVKEITAEIEKWLGLTGDIGEDTARIKDLVDKIKVGVSVITGILLGAKFIKLIADIISAGDKILTVIKKIKKSKDINIDVPVDITKDDLTGDDVVDIENHLKKLFERNDWTDFEKLVGGIVGGAIIGGTISAIASKMPTFKQNLTNDITRALNDSKPNIEKVAVQNSTTIGENCRNAFVTEIKNGLADVQTEMTNSVADMNAQLDSLSEKADETAESIKESFKNAYQVVTTNFKKLPSWWSTNVNTPLTNSLVIVYNAMSKASNTMLSNVESAIERVCSEIHSALESIKQEIDALDGKTITITKNIIERNVPTSDRTTPPYGDVNNVYNPVTYTPVDTSNEPDRGGAGGGSNSGGNRETIIDKQNQKTTTKSTTVEVTLPIIGTTSYSVSMSKSQVTNAVTSLSNALGVNISKSLFNVK